MARFFISRENIRGDNATVAGVELEHMRKVLRLAPGDRVTLFDDGGWEHQGTLSRYIDRAGEIAILKSYRPERESPLRITLAQALGKGEKLDWVVEKATELGVSAIVPFFCERTVPKLDRAASAKRGERWRRIALSATKQSGRTRAPEILDLIEFAELARRPWDCERKIIFWEGESARGLNDVREESPRVDSLLIAIGPEGGFTPDEIALAARAGFQSARLGKRILRTETAAVAAIAAAQTLWGDLG
jgi:16S rRNA (uracil1498-N3)-methyltransferase